MLNLEVPAQCNFLQPLKSGDKILDKLEDFSAEIAILGNGVGFEL